MTSNGVLQILVFFGLLAPFPCIWAIDRILGWLHLA
jgi:hypothetical protein